MCPLQFGSSNQFRHPSCSNDNEYLGAKGYICTKKQTDHYPDYWETEGLVEQSDRFTILVSQRFDGAMHLASPH